MANYLPPEGYLYDEGSGLFYTQTIASDANGKRSQVVTWFNADTGEYTRNTYPIEDVQPSAMFAEYVTDSFPSQDNVPYTKGEKKGLIIGAIIAGSVVTIGLIVLAVVLLTGKNSSMKTREEAQVASEENVLHEDSEIIEKTEPEKVDAKESETDIFEKEMNSEYEDSYENEEEYVEEYSEEGEYSEDEKYYKEQMEKEASKKESEYNQEMGEEGNYRNLDFMYTTFYDSDPDIPYEYEPYISFDKDGTFYLMLNFGEGMQGYDGTYTVKGRESEMDDITITLTISNPSNGIPKKATVVFSDSPDCCIFMDEDFGLMGYYGAPYYFETR